MRLAAMTIPMYWICLDKKLTTPPRNRAAFAEERENLARELSQKVLTPDQGEAILIYASDLSSERLENGMYENKRYLLDLFEVEESTGGGGVQVVRHELRYTGIRYRDCVTTFTWVTVPPKERI